MLLYAGMEFKILQKLVKMRILLITMDVQVPVHWRQAGLVQELSVNQTAEIV